MRRALLVALLLAAAMLLVRLTAASPVAGRACAPAQTGTCTVTVMPTTSGTPSPGLQVSGHVRLGDASGPGVSGVRVMLAFASYPAHETCLTDADGYYQTRFHYIPGDEMVRVWAEDELYAFEPEVHYWRHWYGRELAVRDFLATPLPMCTPPLCQPGEVLYCPDYCPRGCGYQCATPTASAGGRIYLPVILRPFSGSG